jgi:hypothetical protein
MSKLTELFKQYNLSTVKRIENNGQTLNRYSFLNFYGEKLRWKEYYAVISCEIEKHSHYFYVQKDGSMAYSWSGQGFLIAKEPLPITVLHELIKTKEDELKAAQLKRFERVKTPRDALRVTFRDLGIKANMVQGVPRIDCGPFELEFFADQENPQVEVSMVYRATTRRYYVGKVKLTTLTIADPGFNKKIEALVFNGKNLNKLMLGEIQPKPIVGE